MAVSTVFGLPPGDLVAWIGSISVAVALGFLVYGNCAGDEIYSHGPQLIVRQAPYWSSLAIGAASSPVATRRPSPVHLRSYLVAAHRVRALRGRPASTDPRSFELLLSTVSACSLDETCHTLDRQASGLAVGSGDPGGVWRALTMDAPGLDRLSFDEWGLGRGLHEQWPFVGGVPELSRCSVVPLAPHEHRTDRQGDPGTG